MTNPFELNETNELNEPIIIDQGNGTYRISVSILIEIAEKKVKIISQNNFVRKDENGLDFIPEEFKDAILEANPEIPEFVARKFYEVIKESRNTGVTKREIMRLCGPHANSKFCDEVLSSLTKSKILAYLMIRQTGRGRPRNVWMLREMI
jgi:hypothetical protein